MAIVVLLGGCVTDPDSISPVIPVPSAKGAYIVNEGTWGRGNASLSYYDLETFGVFNDIFQAANGRSLGDVANQMVVRNGRGYIVVNNSNRIEVIDLASNQAAGTINTGAGSSPRQIAFWGDSVLLVTALYDNSVLLFSLEGQNQLSRIQVGDNPEGIVVTNGKAFVANSGLGSGRTMSVISLLTRQVIKTIVVGDNPSSVALSSEGLVYVVCGGFYNDFSNPNDDTPAKVAIVDPRSDTVVDSLLLGGHASVIALTLDGRGYIPTSNRVVAIDTRVRRVIGTFVNGSYYGVGVEEVSGDVYLTNPKDYLQPGEVFVYAANGQLRNRFGVGVIPGSIAFKR
jgi:hypothetical protein